MKKNIIYALFTFCFVLFAGNWALGQSSNDDIKVEIADPTGNRAIDINSCDFFDVHLSTQEYIVKFYHPDLGSEIFPGVGGVPHMYLIAYSNGVLNNNNLIAAERLEFYEVNNESNIRESLPTSAFLINLTDNYEIACSEDFLNPTETMINYQVTIGYFDVEDNGSSIVRNYISDSAYSHFFWPDNQGFDFQNAIIDIERVICCIIENGDNEIFGVGLVSQNQQNENSQEAKEIANNNFFDDHWSRDNIKLEQGSTLIFPNPIKSKLNINYELQEKSFVEINILDNRGLNKKNVRFIGDRGMNQIYLDLSQLSSGLYFLNFKSGERNWTKKIMKE